MLLENGKEYAMLNALYEQFGGASSVALVIISISLMLFCGFAMTRLTKLLKLPNVTAYIITGIIIGPYCLNIIPADFIASTDFLTDIALAFIAFGVGEYFKVSTLKKSGVKAAIITVFESIFASLTVFILTYFVLHLDMVFSIVLSALAAATAPASTLMTIRQTHAKGDFVDTLLQVVAMDDVVGLVAYSVAISVAVSAMGGGKGDSSIAMILTPLITNFSIMALGGIFAFVLKFLMPHKRSTDNRLIISIGVIFLFCSICAFFDVSPLLGCMAMGMVYTNVTDDDKLFKQLNYFTPPILLLFFVRSGLSFRLDTLADTGGLTGSVSLLAVGISYFFVRIIGKYAGAYLGCLVTGKAKEVRNYLGLALIPQAGVAIGLAALCVRSLGDEVGGSLQTIILASSVLYELIGPACAKLSLYLSHSYSNKLERITEVSVTEETGIPKTPIEILIERLQQIQDDLALEAQQESEDERAFSQAAEEQYEAFDPPDLDRVLLKR